MTRSNAAGAAQTQTKWSQTLRITEASGLPLSSDPGNVSTAINTLRTIWGKLKLTWRWIERKHSQQISSRRMRIAESISLGEKRSVSIVVVDGAQYLISSSSGGVHLLTRLEQTAKQPSGNEVSS